MPKENAQPRLWIESTWLPVEVLEEIAPKKPRFSGELVISVRTTPEDGGPVWTRFGGKRLKVPAYMVYNYTATVDGVKPNRTPKIVLGGYGVRKGGKAIERTKIQTDRIIDLEDAEVSTTGPVMFDGAGAEVTETPIAEDAPDQTDAVTTE